MTVVTEYAIVIKDETLNRSTVMPKTEEYGAVNVIAGLPNKILLIMDMGEDKPRWKFPGGHVEKGETYAQAATRELREETGIIFEINDTHRIGHVLYPNYVKVVYQINIQNHIETLHEVSSEGELAKIFTLSEIKRMGIHEINPEHYKRLKKMKII